MGQGSTSPGYSVFKPQTTIKPYFYQSIKVKCVQERSDENRMSQNSNFNQNQYLYQYSKLYRVQISVTRVQFQVRVMKMKNVPSFEKISTFIQIFCVNFVQKLRSVKNEALPQLSSVNFKNSSISKIYRAQSVQGEERSSIPRFKAMNDDKRYQANQHIPVSYEISTNSDFRIASCEEGYERSCQVFPT